MEIDKKKSGCRSFIWDHLHCRKGLPVPFRSKQPFFSLQEAGRDRFHFRWGWSQSSGCDFVIESVLLRRYSITTPYYGSPEYHADERWSINHDGPSLIHGSSCVSTLYHSRYVPRIHIFTSRIHLGQPPETGFKPAAFPRAFTPTTNHIIQQRQASKTHVRKPYLTPES